MAKTILIGGATASNTSVANTTQYNALVGDARSNTSEAAVQVPFHVPGKFYSLGIRMSANSVSASTVFTLRRNGAGSALTFPVSSNQTGWFEDVNHTVDVAGDGDLFCVQAVPGSGSTGTFTHYLIKAEFDTTLSTTLSATRIGTTTGVLNTGHIGASTSYYYQIEGAIPTGSTTNSTEANSQVYQQYAAKIENLGVKYTANSRTATTVRLRKNTANGALVITVPASPNGTGWKEDLVNVETVAAADLVNYSITNGTGTSAASLFGLVCDYVTETDPGVGICNCGYTTIQTVSKATTNYIPIVGKWNGAITTEAYAQAAVNDAYTFKGMTVVVTANAIGGQSNATFRVNGGNSAMTVPIAGSQTGVFTDLSHTVTVAAGDMVNSMIVGGAQSGSATISIKTVTMWTEIAGQVTGPTKSVTLEEAITMGENYARLQGNNRALATQALTTGETYTRLRLRLKTTANSLSLVDEYTKSKGKPRTATDFLTITHVSTVGLRGRLKTLSESFVAVHVSTIRLRGKNRASSGSITISHTTDRVRSFLRLLAESLSLSNVFNKDKNPPIPTKWTQVYETNEWGYSMLPDYSAASQSDLWAVTKPNGTFLDFLTLPGAIPLLEWTGGQYTWRLRVVTPNPDIFIEQVYASRMTPDLGTWLGQHFEYPYITLDTAQVYSGTFTWDDTQNDNVYGEPSINDVFYVAFKLNTLSETPNELIEIGFNMSPNSDEWDTPWVRASVVTKIRTLAHSASITASHVRLRGKINAFSDSFGLNHTFAGLRELVKPVSESVTLLHSFMHLSAKLRSISAGLSVLETTLEYLREKVRPLSESVTMATDTPAKITARLRTLSQSLGLSDIYAGSKLRVQSFTDSVTLSASFAQRIVSRVKSISQSISMTDSTEILRGKIGALSHSLEMSSSTVKLTTRVRDLSHALTYISLVERFQTKGRSLFETLSMESTTSTILSRIRTLVESVEFLAGVLVSRDIIRSITSSMNLSDSIARLRLRAITLSHSLTATNTLEKLTTRIRTLSHTINYLDTLTTGSERLAQLFHSLSYNDSLYSYLTERIRTLTHSLPISTTHLWLRLKIKSVSGGSIALSHSIAVRLPAKIRTLTHSLTFVDSLTTGIVKLMQLFHSFSYADMYSRMAARKRGFATSLSMGSSISKSLSRIRTFTSSLNLSITSLIEVKSLLREFSDSLQFTDFIETVQLTAASFTDSLELNHALEKSRTKLRTVTETIGLISEFLHNRLIVRKWRLKSPYPFDETRVKDITVIMEEWLQSVWNVTGISVNDVEFGKDREHLLRSGKQITLKVYVAPSIRENLTLGDKRIMYLDKATILVTVLNNDTNPDARDPRAVKIQKFLEEKIISYQGKNIKGIYEMRLKRSDIALKGEESHLTVLQTGLDIVYFADLLFI